VDRYPYPPKNLMFMDPSVEKMLENGRKLLGFVQDEGYVRLEGSVLDVGCGYGRSAYALLEMGFTGRYLGFDILPKHVSWLSEHLSTSTTPPIFEFRHLDVCNERYNPDGKFKAIEASLPVPAQPPDLILAFSVFTHMYADEISHYLEQLAALMGPDSVLCATFFLMNPSWQACEAQGKSAFPMDFVLDENCRYHDREDPLAAIAFREEWVRSTIEEAGLVPANDVHLGSWCGRGKDQPCYQDTFFLTLAGR
jgi:SAM-dependent methyltransferase